MSTTEINQSNPVEQLTESLRSEHAPVPLDPWNAMHPLYDQESYLLASTSRIGEILDEAFAEGLGWWAESPYHAAILYTFMQDALFEAQMKRFHHNAVRTPVSKEEYLDDDPVEIVDKETVEKNKLPLGIIELLDRNDPIVKKALKGNATPKELVYLFKENPILESVELAKQSHPLDFTATRKMDYDINLVIDECDALRTESSPKYEVLNFDEVNDVMIVERKQIIAMIAEEGLTPIAFVKREILILRGDDDATDGNHLMRRRMRDSQKHHELQEPKRLDELWEKAEIYLSYLNEEQNLRRVDVNPQVKWIQPLTTSVYLRHEATTA